ncbi:hypothetical protein [Paenibacillus sp. VMFN-D1]|uniref:hypothetical protein n=1 Tax=Paenibacillus sp. VMFN-D1 TaxID=2135608 RepID=UPI0011C04466|nr:hypothetical protein [Paenibacillus sp. VMFN-D1]
MKSVSLCDAGLTVFCACGLALEGICRQVRRLRLSKLGLATKRRVFYNQDSIKWNCVSLYETYHREGSRMQVRGSMRGMI